MKAYLLIIVFICFICKYTSLDMMPELKRNILNFLYGINFKSEGMLSHLLDRFYVVTKFILQTTEDVKFLLIIFDSVLIPIIPITKQFMTF